MKTPDEIILEVIKQLKEEIKFCDKSIDIRIVQTAIKKIASVLKPKI